MNSLIIHAGFPLLSFLIFFPLGAAFVLLFYNGEKFARYWALTVTGVEAVVSLFLLPGFDPATVKFQFAEVHPWIPGFHVNYILGVDGISILLVLFTTLIMPFCVLASWRSVKTGVTWFMFWLLILQVAMVGLFVSLDFVLFWVFSEFMLIPMYLLINIWGGPRREYASTRFVVYTLAGSVLLLAAIIALYLEKGSFFIPDMMWQHYSPSFQLLVFLAFFLAFAVRAAMFPLHSWLPAAHVEAPVAGSVMLASVLPVMGTYGMLRFCLPITPAATLMLAPYVLWLSIIGIIFGGFTALAHHDMKKLVACFSVGHMGFVSLGIFILDSKGLEGAILQMVNHGVTISALFLCAGMIQERTHSREVQSATGVGVHMPWFVTLLAFFALSASAFPGTNFFIGEFLILAGVFTKNIPLALAAVPGVVLAAACMLRLLQKIIRGGVDNPDHSYITDLNFREIIILAPFLLFVLWIGLSPQPFLDLVHTSVIHLLEQLHGIHGAHVAAALLK